MPGCLPPVLSGRCAHAFSRPALALPVLFPPCPALHVHHCACAAVIWVAQSPATSPVPCGAFAPLPFLHGCLPVCRPAFLSLLIAPPLACRYDTAVRLVKPEYYGSDQAMLLQVGCCARCAPLCLMCFTKLGLHVRWRFCCRVHSGAAWARTALLSLGGRCSPLCSCTAALRNSNAAVHQSCPSSPLQLSSCGTRAGPSRFPWL